MPPSEHFAGVERVTHHLAESMAVDYADRVEPHVIYCNDFPEVDPDRVSYRVHVLGVERLRSLGPSVRAAVEDVRPDVLVVPQIEATAIVWLATRRLGVPTFVTHLHGNFRVEEAEGTRRTRALYQLYRRVIGPRTQATFAVSPELAEAAGRELNPLVPTVFVPNPVSVVDGGWSPRTTTDDLRLVSVARLDRQKGQDLLLEALARALPDLPPTTVTLVGSGPLEGDLRRQVDRLGLQDVVVLTGQAPPVPHLVEADAFVLASRWEGFGNVLVEALGVGLPLLATDCDFGPAGLVDSPQMGVLTPSEDVGALATGLVELARRLPELRAAGAVQARRARAAAYTSERVVAQHLDAVLHLSVQRPRP